jgi:hypothetical protein
MMWWRGDNARRIIYSWESRSGVFANCPWRQTVTATGTSVLLVTNSIPDDVGSNGSGLPASRHVPSILPSILACIEFVDPISY